MCRMRNFILPSLGLVRLASSTFFYPTVQAALLEHILVDTHGAHASDIVQAITPCTNYVSGAQTLGRETAAQWIRVSFHDFVTADVVAGTGGIDASIGFETLRAENSGSAMNDSLGFFRPYVSAKIGTADFIALSVVMSVGNCGGPKIPLRGGRIDATSPGTTGVPAPDTSLEETLEFFSSAGFNQNDSIALTACGHTMGNVHNGGFPTVVGPEAITANNTGGGVHFDSTVAVFDPLVVHEYLNGTGNQGGPLVTSFNVSSRSDLRLYESDNNATMITLANQGSGFLDTCVKLLQRMLETVPRGVILSDVVSPMPIKPIDTTLDFDANGDLIFTGYIRLLSSTPDTSSQSLVLAIPTDKNLTLSPEPETGSSIFGFTTFFTFNTTISSPETFDLFTVSTGNEAVNDFQVQSAAFVVPSLTSIFKVDNTTTIVNFTVAMIKGSAVKRDEATKPNVIVQAPVAQMGTLGPAIATFDNVTAIKTAEKSDYDVWEGSVTFENWTLGPICVAILDKEGNEIDIVLVD